MRVYDGADVVRCRLLVMCVCVACLFSIDVFGVLWIIVGFTCDGVFVKCMGVVVDIVVCVVLELVVGV